MKVLIVDRDELSAQLIRSKLEPLGHTVEEESSKNDAVDRIKEGRHNLVIMDPAPLTSARPVTLNIRRGISHYPYIILTSENMSREQALKDSANDILHKPIDGEALIQKAQNAKFLTDLIKRIGDTSEDFPSAGGVIAKSAFNQLFLSSIDRADRYGESTFIIFISLNNYQELLEMDGPYAADFASAKLSQTLVRIRRQSDIIAQTGKSEYALLLQRPLYETEPLEAANRFAETLSKQEGLSADGRSNVEISVRLVDMPTGASIVNHIIEV